MTVDTTAGLYRPLHAIAATEPATDGVLTGLASIDRLTGGLRPGRLNLVGGYSGNGKTALMLSAGIRMMTEETPFLFLTCDDSDDAILHKALAMHYGLTLDDVERRGAAWRTEAVRDLEGCLAVCAPQRTSAYAIDDVMFIYQELCDIWNRPPKFACFDYLSLLSVGWDDGNGMQGVKAKAAKLKALCRSTSDTVWLMGHQCKKEAGSDCPALTLNHLEFGGHQEADGVVLGCRRRLTTTKMPDWEIALEETQPTTNVSVMKNKVTGRTSPDPRGSAYVIDPTSGILREFSEEEVKTRERKGKTQASTIAIRYPGQYVGTIDDD